MCLQYSTRFYHIPQYSTVVFVDNPNASEWTMTNSPTKSQKKESNETWWMNMNHHESPWISDRSWRVWMSLKCSGTSWNFSSRLLTAFDIIWSHCQKHVKTFHNTSPLWWSSPPMTPHDPVTCCTSGKARIFRDAARGVCVDAWQLPSRLGARQYVGGEQDGRS